MQLKTEVDQIFQSPLRKSSGQKKVCVSRSEPFSKRTHTRAYRFKSMEKRLETEQKVPSSVKSALRRVSAEKYANPTN